MKPTSVCLLLLGAVVVSVSGIAMPDHALFKRNCTDAQVTKMFKKEWYERIKLTHVVWVSNNLRWIMLDRLLGKARTEAMTEMEASDTCVTVHKVQMSLIPSISSMQPNMSSSWMIHLNQHRPGASDSVYNGEYKASGYVICTDNETYLLREVIQADGNYMGFVLNVVDDKEIPGAKLDEIKKKLGERGYKEDMYSSVSKKCLDEYKKEYKMKSG